MSNKQEILLEMEISLHAADCPGGDECGAHGDKYAKLALAAYSVLPAEYEPYWLHGRRIIQESALNLIYTKLDAIAESVKDIQ